MEEKGQEIHEAAGSISAGFPELPLPGMWGGRRAADPLPSVSVCKPSRETGGCGAQIQAAATAEGGSGRGVGGARSSAPRPRPGHRGRCRPPTAQLRRREAEPGVSQEVPGQWCIPASHPPPGAAFVWEPREEEKRRETAAADLTEGAWSAGGGARGRVAAGECARLAGELRGGGPAPRAPRLAWPTRAEPESLLHRHTPTELHRIPPSTRRPRWPPPRLGQQDPAPSPGLVRRAKNPLIFFPPSLQPSLVWAAAAAAGG